MSVRVVRPRPLGLTERIPVFWSGREAPEEIRAVDGGTLYRYLLEQENIESSARKRGKPQQYKAPKEGRRSTALDGASIKDIPLPGVRHCEGYDLNQAAMAVHGPQIAGDIALAPYVRYTDWLPGLHGDHERPAQYDMEEDDEAFLLKLNGQDNGRGLMAAARGLYNHVASRFRTSSSDGGVSSGAGSRPEPRTTLNADEFEHTIDKLEYAHFEALQAWLDCHGEGPSTSAAALPKLPPMKTLLSKLRAMELLPEIDKKVVASLYEHWVKKRSSIGGPLLPHLWFEMPWKAIAFAHLADEEGIDGVEHLPFSGGEPRSAQQRGRRRMTDTDAVEALRILRSELETVRTLADQVRRREKLKRTDAHQWQQEWRLRLATGRAPPPAPKRQRLEQPAAPAPAGPQQKRGARPTFATAEARAGRAGKAVASKAAAQAEQRADSFDSPPTVDRETGLTTWGARRRRGRPSGPATVSGSPIKARRGRPALRGAAAKAAAAAQKRRLAACDSSAEVLKGLPFHSTAESEQLEDWQQSPDVCSDDDRDPDFVTRSDQLQCLRPGGHGGRQRQHVPVGRGRPVRRRLTARRTVPEEPPPEQPRQLRSRGGPLLQQSELAADPVTMRSVRGRGRPVRQRLPAAAEQHTSDDGDPTPASGDSGSAAASGDAPGAHSQSSGSAAEGASHHELSDGSQSDTETPARPPARRSTRGHEVGELLPGLPSPAPTRKASLRQPVAAQARPGRKAAKQLLNSMHPPPAGARQPPHVNLAAHPSKRAAGTRAGFAGKAAAAAVGGRHAQLAASPTKRGRRELAGLGLDEEWVAVLSSPILLPAVSKQNPPAMALVRQQPKQQALQQVQRAQRAPAVQTTRASLKPCPASGQRGKRELAALIGGPLAAKRRRSAA